MGGAAKQQQHGKRRKLTSKVHHGSCMGRSTTWGVRQGKGWVSAEEEVSVWGGNNRREGGEREEIKLIECDLTAHVQTRRLI